MNVESGERDLTLFCHKTNSSTLKIWADNTKAETGCEKNCV